jgi:hypothetical protein
MKDERYKAHFLKISFLIKLLLDNNVRLAYEIIIGNKVKKVKRENRIF